MIMIDIIIYTMYMCECVHVYVLSPILSLPGSMYSTSTKCVHMSYIDVLRKYLELKVTTCTHILYMRSCLCTYVHADVHVYKMYIHCTCTCTYVSCCAKSCGSRSNAAYRVELLQSGHS